jgi:hypothetical protein
MILMRRPIVKILIISLLFFLFPLFVPTQAVHLPDLALEGITRTHSEMIKESPHSWKIFVNDKTSVENESIRIEILEGTSQSPSLRSSGHVDFYSLNTIVNDVTSPGMTEEEKALALWRFVMDNCYPGPWGTCFDGLEHLNVYGYGYCGTFVAALEPLLWTAGLKARHVNTGNHAVTEAYYGHDWHYLDAHLRCFFLEKDNQTIASLDDLNNDPGLWDMKRHRQSPQRGRKKYYYMTMHPTGDRTSLGYSKDFTMAKGDILTLTWQKSGKWCLARGAEGGGEPAPEPPIYANGTFEFHRDLSKPSESRTGLVYSKNIDCQDLATGYLHPVKTKEEAHLVYQVRVPYFIPEVTISGDFFRKNSEDSISIDISTDNGVNWVEIWKGKKTGRIRAKANTNQTQRVTTDTPWKYSYLIRIRMRAETSPLDVGGYLLESTNHLFYNPKSLPALKGGDNTVTFRDKADSPRLVKVTYQWQEDHPIRVSKEFPLEGEEIFLSARVLNLGPGTVSNIPVFFYLGDPQQGGIEIGRDLIEKIDSGGVGYAKVRWKATRRWPGEKGTAQNAGQAIYVIVNPTNIIRESNKKNNTSFKIIKVLNPSEVQIPSESFVKFEKRQDHPDVIRITATIRNFSSSHHYGYYLNDHAEATGVVVKFFDGEPIRRNQIGSDLVIDQLRPLEFKNVSVDWNVSKLKGLHKIYVQVFPDENMTQALGVRDPKEVAASIDLDAYRACRDAR